MSAEGEETRSTYDVNRVHVLIWMFLAAAEGVYISLLYPVNRVFSSGKSFQPFDISFIVYVFIFHLFPVLLIIAGIWILSNKPHHSIFFNKTSNLIKQFGQNVKWIVPGICITYILLFLAVNQVYGMNNPFANYFLEPLSGWFFLCISHSIVQKFILDCRRKCPELRRPFIITSAVIILVWVFISISGVGIIPDDRYWNVAGVPVLATQLAGIIASIILANNTAALIGKKIQIHPKLKKIIFWMLIPILIWVSTALLWINTPFDNSFFAEGPFPPNNDLYPYSDAALMDLGGQYMLIGEGLNYPHFTEKSFYVFFVGILHKIISQNYFATTSLQIACFAIFPVLLYALASNFINKSTGLMLALFAMIKERNALISTFKISVSHSRLIMTEFPTSIMLLLFCFLFFLWLRNKEQKKPYLLLAGGVLGFACMVRTTPILLVPIVLVMLVFFLKFKWKKAIHAALIFVIGFILAIGPWIVYDQLKYGANPYTSKISAVINSRLRNIPVVTTPIVPGVESQFILNFHKEPSVADIELEPLNLDSLNYLSITTGHFLNNEIKALFTLPFTLYPQYIRYILTSPQWAEPVVSIEMLPPATIYAFVMNLLLISVGITFAWKKWQLGGLLPLLINVAYYLGNALGRTSGGRYVLAVDWTVYFYYFYGIAALISFAGKASKKPSPSPGIMDNEADISTVPQSRRLPIWFWGLIVLVTASIQPIVDSSFPRLYGYKSDQELILEVAEHERITGNGFSEYELRDFIENRGGVILYGRMLYPRFREFEELGQTGLFLTVLTPELLEVFIPLESTPSEVITPGDDVIILGCPQETYILGRFAWVLESDKVILTQDTSLSVCSVAP